jgi:hypothetical protein
VFRFVRCRPRESSRFDPLLGDILETAAASEGSATRGVVGYQTLMNEVLAQHVRD